MWFLLVPELLRPRGRAGQHPWAPSGPGTSLGDNIPASPGAPSEPSPLHSLRRSPPVGGICVVPAEPPQVSECRWINPILLEIGSFLPPLLPILLPGICQPGPGARGGRESRERGEGERRGEAARGGSFSPNCSWKGEQSCSRSVSLPLSQPLGRALDVGSAGWTGLGGPGITVIRRGSSTSPGCLHGAGEYLWHQHMGREQEGAESVAICGAQPIPNPTLVHETTRAWGAGVSRGGHHHCGNLGSCCAFQKEPTGTAVSLWGFPSPSGAGRRFQVSGGVGDASFPIFHSTDSAARGSPASVLIPPGQEGIYRLLQPCPSLLPSLQPGWCRAALGTLALAAEPGQDERCSVCCRRSLT